MTLKMGSYPPQIIAIIKSAGYILGALSCVSPGFLGGEKVFYGTYFTMKL
jgi:hypothetical protein